jgi:hypothetical protein
VGIPYKDKGEFIFNRIVALGSEPDNADKILLIQLFDFFNPRKNLTIATMSFKARINVRSMTNIEFIR